MVPELSISAAAHLEQNKRVIRQTISESPESVADVMCKVLEQNANYASILKKATLHIAELETREVLSSYGSRPAPPDKLPWYLKYALQIAGYSIEVPDG